MMRIADSARNYFGFRIIWLAMCALSLLALVAIFFAARQPDNAEVIKQLALKGAVVSGDEQVAVKYLNRHGAHSICELASQLKGLYAIDFSHTDLCSDGLAQILASHQLQGIIVHGTNVGDAVLLKHPQKQCVKLCLRDCAAVGSLDFLATWDCNPIREIDVAYTGIGPADISHVSNLKNLRVLRINGVIVDANAITDSDGSSALEVVEMSDCTLSSDIGETLTTHQRLRELYVSRTTFGDDDLATLSKCKSLELLALDSTRVTGDGLKMLTSCKRIRELWVSHLPLRKEELLVLSELPNLRILRCEGVGLPAKEWSELQQSMPQVKVMY